MKDFALVVVNMASFFAAVVAIIAWYNTLVPLHRRAPWMVTRLPLLAGLGAMIVGVQQGWAELTSGFVLIGLFLGGLFLTSFVLSFLGAWALRAKLDQDERERGQGPLSPALLSWSAALLVMLAVVGVNAAAFGVKSPFWVHVG